ncbi:hypothetical protein DERF_012343 [Dermatophagoides farinae]|uniref:Uncharacterized protein n=1 Tax=Dermatophagoides farinae TaxID=6954 RepID=A0A922KX75_DERFA|nr:hypothetical protein DERF_012343 [Dermatophagoides farinae]
MSKPTFFWKARRWWCWWNFDRFILSISESEMKLAQWMLNVIVSRHHRHHISSSSSLLLNKNSSLGHTIQYD